MTRLMAIHREYGSSWHDRHRRIRPAAKGGLVVALLVCLVAVSALFSSVERAAWLVTAAQAAATSPAVVVRPGDDLQAAIDGHPEGTTFLLLPGVYREQSLDPKDGQAFVGDGQAILSGARVLTGWRREGRFWLLPDLPPALPVDPAKLKRFERIGPPEAVAREMLFLDGQLYRRAGRLAELRPGAWYRDGDRAVILDDPAGRLTELAVTEDAFHGRAVGLLLRNIVVEKYASATHRGTIEGRRARGWRLEGVVARLNHAIGLRAGDGFVVEGGSYSDNGQVGITVPRNDVTIRNAEICRNNTLGHAENWEAGGIKVFASAERTLIEGNVVCDNRSNGVWTDGSARDPVIRNNRIYGNSRSGIHLELTYGGLTEGNQVYDNGRGLKGGGMNVAQILITQTSDTEVRNNLVVVPPGGPNGIGLRHYKRGPWITVGNRIHDNRIVYLAQSGRSGAFARNDAENMRDNLFDHNSYVMPEGGHDQYWWFDGALRSQADLAALGQERNGAFMRSADPAAYAKPPGAD